MVLAFAFHHSVLASCRPPLEYLWVSLGMGYALVVWLFWAANMHGKWVVVCGAPTASIIAGCWWTLWGPRTTHRNQRGENMGDDDLFDDSYESGFYYEIDVVQSPQRT